MTGDKKDTPIMFIDLEPTWESLCRISEQGALKPINLMPACKVADKIRQAQKDGKKAIRFVFADNGDVTIEEE